MTCPNCKAPVPPGASACPRCGQKFVAGKFCVHCKAVIPATAQTCPKCGKSQAVSSSHIPPKAKAKFMWWYALIAILLVVAGIGVGAQLTHPKTKEADKETPSSSSESAPMPTPSSEISKPIILESKDIDSVFASIDNYRKKKISFTAMIVDEPTRHEYSVTFRAQPNEEDPKKRFIVSYAHTGLGLMAGDTVIVEGKITSIKPNVLSDDIYGDIDIIYFSANTVDILSHSDLPEAPIQTPAPESDIVPPEAPSAYVSNIWSNHFTPINDFRYALDRFNHTITLNRYEGDDTKIMLSPVYTINGVDYKLISMGDNACFLCETEITSVYIPEGVTTINSTCFNSCAKLEHIYLPSTLEHIPNDFFGYLHEFRVAYDNSITLPGDRDYTDYPEKVDADSEAYQLGENFARALNGMVGGFANDEIITHIYFGGSEDTWNYIRD